jgi:hypothetical protein
MSAVEPGVAETNVTFGPSCTDTGPPAVFSVRDVAVRATIVPRRCSVAGGAAFAMETDVSTEPAINAAASREKRV